MKVIFETKTILYFSSILIWINILFLGPFTLFFGLNDNFRENGLLLFLIIVFICIIIIILLTFLIIYSPKLLLSNKRILYKSIFYKKELLLSDVNSIKISGKTPKLKVIINSNDGEEIKINLFYYTFVKKQQKALVTILKNYSNKYHIRME